MINLAIKKTLTHHTFWTKYKACCSSRSNFSELLDSSRKWSKSPQNSLIAQCQHSARMAKRFSLKCHLQGSAVPKGSVIKRQDQLVMMAKVWEQEWLHVCQVIPSVFQRENSNYKSYSHRVGHSLPITGRMYSREATQSVIISTSCDSISKC